MTNPQNRITDMQGRRYGRLLVLDVAAERYQGHIIAWRCRCDCGAEVDVPGISLRSGGTRSCGCIKRERQRELARALGFASRKYPPGEVKKTIYYVWAGMKSRCADPNNDAFRWYGGRGIRVCAAWQDYATFRDWAYGHGYRPDLTIERIDVDGDYEPANCTWIPLSEQWKNMQRTKRAKEAANARQ